MKGTLTIVSGTQFKLKPTWVDDNFKNENSFKELTFKKK